MRHPEPTSFICEHTAEYVLVPQACEALRTRFKVVTPLFFWASREGSGQARDAKGSVRVISIFARRPKFVGMNSDTVIVRFNAELFERASESAEYGIPVYAGVPVATTFSELGSEPPWRWFKLAGRSETQDLQLNPPNTDHIQSTVLVEISLATLVEDSRIRARELDLDMALEALRSIGRNRSRDSYGRGFWSRFGGYKPFHILIWDSPPPINPLQQTIR